MKEKRKKTEFGTATEPDYVTRWLDRVGVIVPPTTVSRGVVRFWHAKGAYYTSVVINPLFDYSPEFKINKGSVDYTDNTIYTNNDTEDITLVNDTEVGEGNETEWIEWYVDGVLYGTRDTTIYTTDTIGNNTVNLTISADTTVTLRVKIAKNDDYKEVTHSINYVKNTVGGSAATATGGDVTIGSDSLGSEDYNTVDGIPTGKDIYARVQTDEYIIDYLFELRTGGRSYTATISGQYDNGDGTTESFTETRSVSRSYSYYDLSWYYVYEIDQAVVSNYALPSGSLTLVPPGSYGIGSSYSMGSLNSRPSSESTNVGTVPRNYNFSSKARSMIDSYSTTDARITITGTQDGTVTVTGSGTTPTPRKTDRELYGETTIIETLANRSNTPSNAVITYSLVNSYNSTASPTTDIGISGNSVTVHSPVVCYPDIVNDTSDETQHMDMNGSRDQLIIGESFTIEYPLDGQHRSILGYGNRDYSDTTLNRQIQFSFDTYIGTDDSGGNGDFLEAGTWHDFVQGGEDHSTEEVDYYIPHWNNETSGGGVIRFRTVPNNIQDVVSDGYGFNQNDTTSEYKAVESITVELSSKAYGFAVTDITDPNWEDHFNDPGLSMLSDAYLDASVLPVMEGKNSVAAYEDYSIKLGYEALFSFITSGGDMTGRDDVVLITPTYYHVNADGSGRQEVDVYYETKNGFVALGGSQDDKANNMILNKDGRGLESSEIRDTASVLDSQNRGNGFDEDKYYDALSGQYDYNIKHEDKLLLTEMQKTYVGQTGTDDGTTTGNDNGGLGHSPSGVSGDDILEGTQKWYGEFYLPSQSVFVPAGTDLTDNVAYPTLKMGKAPFITDGYIIVNFQIDVYHNIADTTDLTAANHYMTYNNDDPDNGNNNRGNRWDMEGFDTNQALYTLYYGDTLFYHVDKRASDDYK